MTQVHLIRPKTQDLFEEHFGSDLNFLQCEVLAIKHVPHKLLRQEAELCQKRWFDYRRLHPVQTTYLLAKEFDRGYKDFIITTRDHRAGQFMKAFKGNDILTHKEMKSVWRLRQLIDGLGIRYDFFIRKAMQWSMRHNWHHVPRPSAFRNEDLVSDVILDWEDECRAKIQWPTDTFYRVENFCGHPDQLELERWIVGQIMQRSRPRFALSHALYGARILRVETALQHFGADLVREAANFPR